MRWCVLAANAETTAGMVKSGPRLDIAADSKAEDLLI